MTILNAQWRPNDGKVAQSVDSTKFLRFDNLTSTDPTARILTRQFSKNDFENDIQ